jgi:hypothetical protein
LVNFLFLHKYIDINIKGEYLREIPIRTVRLSDPNEKQAYQNIINSVQEIMQLKNELSAELVPDERTRLEREVKSIDEQLDAAVYSLYGLNAEEIRTVQGENNATNQTE